MTCVVFHYLEQLATTDQADEVGKASAAECNHELTVANNDERQYFKAKMGPVGDDVISKISAVGVDQTALAYFKEEVKSKICYRNKNSLLNYE